MSIDIEVQKAIRYRLMTYAVGVPNAQILDVNQRPAELPAILLGDSQAIDEGTSLRRSRTRVYHTLHIWKKEPSLEGIKTIAGAIRSAIHSAPLTLVSGLHCADARVSSQRFLRDPDGEHAHGVVVVEVLVSETVA